MYCMNEYTRTRICTAVACYTYTPLDLLYLLPYLFAIRMQIVLMKVMKFILICFCFSLSGGSKEDFNSLLYSLLADFQKMMESNQPTSVGTQARALAHIYYKIYINIIE